jgi:hypothetical protein
MVSAVGRSILWWALAMTGAGLVVTPRVAVAQPADVAQPKPWSEGISPDAQSRALEIYNQGNALFGENQFNAALQKYREALTFWDHPRIRYNIAICLTELDQPVEALDNLEKALRFGAAPFDAQTYTQAQRDLKSLHRQVAELEVSCTEAGAEVTLDGRPLFTAPGKKQVRLVPGPHALVATKQGFVTASRSLVLVPGKVDVEAITLVPLRPVVVMQRRWAAWKPWAVVGAGAAVGLIGVPLRLRSTSDIDNYNAYVNSECPGGCPTAELPPGIRDLPGRARTENAIAIGLMTAGGAALITGAVLVILNLPRQETLDDGDPARARNLKLAPMAVSGGGGISAAVAF